LVDTTQYFEDLGSTDQTECTTAGVYTPVNPTLKYINGDATKQGRAIMLVRNEYTNACLTTQFAYKARNAQDSLTAITFNSYTVTEGTTTAECYNTPSFTTAKSSAHLANARPLNVWTGTNLLEEFSQ
jgi:hypothetical protein